MTTLIGRNGTVSLPVMGRVLAGTTGFQSPADDYVDERIDLAKELVTNAASTFCYRVEGQSGVEVGIMDGSLAVIDFSLRPTPNKIVLVRLADVLTLKKIILINGRLHLCAPGGNRSYKIIPVDKDEGVHIMGVLKHCVNSYD